MGNQPLQFLKDWLLEWLEQYNCSQGVASDGCISGIDSLIGKIKKPAVNEIAGHAFHAYLVKRLHETGIFEVKQVEVKSGNGKKSADIRLRSKANGAEPEDLFIEAWRGKSPFSHRRDDLASMKSGAFATRLDKDAETVESKLNQLPEDCRGFVVNYMIGTGQQDILPIAKTCSNNKCVITVRSNMRAYICGSADFKYMEDARRLCDIFCWLPCVQLGKSDSDAKVIAKDTITIKDAVKSVKGITRNVRDGLSIRDSIKVSVRRANEH